MIIFRDFLFFPIFKTTAIKNRKVLIIPVQEVVFTVPRKGIKNAYLRFLPLHISIETTVELSRPIGNLRHKFSKKYIKKLKTQMLQINII